MARNKYGGINDMPTGWTTSKENKRVYALWFDMLRRCYDEEQLQRVRGRTYNDCSVCERWFYLSNFYEDIQKLPGYSEAPSTTGRADSMMEWISVKERLPQATGKYLCAVKDKRGNLWTIASDWSLEMKSWFGDYGEIKNKVTHWMPLPEGPKEG